MSDATPAALPEPLNAVEARILGCLIEKHATTPESYPLTLNALVVACNQKTSREPVMNLDPGPVGASLRQLEGRGLVRKVYGSRADRWEHRVDKGYEVIAEQRVLLGLLLLRGPQTINELFTRSDRMFNFEDAEHVHHDLERLITRGLVVRIPKHAGQREDRFMHLLCGAVDVANLPLPGEDTQEYQPSNHSRLQTLEARVADLEERLSKLEKALY